MNVLFFMLGFVFGAVGWHKFALWLGQKLERRMMAMRSFEGGKEHDGN